MLLRNVLIFHSGALGDFVLSFPVALALARLHPTSRVRYVTSSGKGKLAERMLGVESVDVEGGFSGLFADGAAVPDSVVKMLGSSHRVVGFVAEGGSVWEKRARELAPGARVSCLSTKLPAEHARMHAADWLQEQCKGEKALAGAVGQINALLARQGLVRREGYAGRGVVIHPGAGAAGKCWPLEHYRELALRIKDETAEAIHWVLGEVELERMAGGERRALEAIGDVVVPGSYVGLLEELSAARAFVGNDSGPGHVAGIAGVPTVSVFGGASDAEVWRPMGPHVEVVRGERLTEVTVDAVMAAVGRAIGARAVGV